MAFGASLAQLDRAFGFEPKGRGFESLRARFLNSEVPMDNHHHDLSHEFPEFKDKIHTLKMNDAHFKKLAERYEDLDKKIVRAESRIELCSESEEEVMRKERLELKDQIFAMLNA